MKTAIYYLGSLILLVSGLSAQAQLQCWQSETDPASLGKYAAEEIWEADVRGWEAEEPPHPSLLELFIGNEVARRAQTIAKGLGSDKQAHCFVGCRISRYVDLETALYAGWYKELKDLTDCNVSTHFDLADFDATVAGGELGLTPGACKNLCRRAFPLK